MKISEQNLCEITKAIIENGLFDGFSREKNAVSVYACTQPYVDMALARKTVTELFAGYNLAHIAADDVNRCIRTYLRNGEMTDNTNDNFR